jgi:hypothetical protein
MELEGQSRNPAIILSKGPLAEQIFRAKLALVFPIASKFCIVR